MVRESVLLERLVQRIQKELAPHATVEHDVKVTGKRSNIKRQIDVLVTEHIGQYEITIAIECKDYNRPVDIKGVEEFLGLLRDTGIHQGVLVCPNGFSDAAKTRAEKAGLLLYSPIDTGDHKWKSKVTIPALCDFRVARMGFGISTTTPLPFRLPYEFFSECVIFDKGGSELGTVYQEMARRWNSGEFEEELGLSEKIQVFGPDRLVETDNGYGQRIPVDLTASVHVDRQLFSGHMPIERMSGFRDELSDEIITNAFTVGLLDPMDIIENWTPIAGENDVPELSGILLQGLIMVDEDAQIVIDPLRRGDRAQ